MIADILLAAGALGAAIYCVVLAGRLKRFNNLQNGVGGAVAVLSVQVDDMTKTLEQAQLAAVNSATTLTSLTGRAEDVSRRLELMLASMHDLPEQLETAEPTFDGLDTQIETETLFSSKTELGGEDPIPKACFSSKRSSILETAE